jgi:Zn-dependent metalloprotease
MKKSFPLLFDNRWRSLLVGLLIPYLIVVGLSITRISQAGENGETDSESIISPLNDPNFPKEIDVRAIHGTPRETNLTDAPNATALPLPSKVQLRAAKRLAGLLGALKLVSPSNYEVDTDKLQIKYNGLTATPRHIFNREGYLSAPSNLPAETIALNFVRQNRGLFLFSESDLNNLKLVSRAVSATGTTTLVYNQQLNGKTVYRGDVMVNVAKNGQILNVGGDSYPNLTLANTATISPAQAIQNAAAGLNVNNFAPQSMGSTQVLATYGNLTPEYITGEKFARGAAFGDDIVVTQVVFPMGAVGRLAYKFTLTTPQYYGMMWQHFVDAQTGVTLRRHSLTAFQSFGESGGGTGIGRRGSFRPDVQNLVESFNHPNGTARGKVVDTVPTMLSGYLGFGRSTRTGDGTQASPYSYKAPTYAADSGILTNAQGRGFRFGQAFGRFEFPLPFGNEAERPTFTHAELPGNLGQITRGLPDAANPTAASPFGWFYLPTGAGGAEITQPDANRTSTRALGYTMSAEAVTRNIAVAGNSPAGNGTQPFSADVTPLGAGVTLPDGRTLNSVYQSRYTEGNNVLTSDDRANDNEAGQGIKGYAENRQFTAGYFDYLANYEYAGQEATGGGTGGGAAVIPTSANQDVVPGAVTLFYFNNIVHDYLYDIGFTEQFWNFQMDNFGKGGAGGDHVITQVQDGSGTNNANMGTPDEGGAPRMQMYLFNEATFRRSDGSFDFDVVAHEQFHGVSNRSAGKGGTGCLGITLVGESGGMGEGWGDYIGSSMTDDDVAGDFVTGQFDIGIRKLPMTNYRYSYGAVNNRLLNVRRKDPAAQTDTPDPVTSSANPFAVHSIGELWSSTLWDMRELLIMKQKVGASFPGVFFDGARRVGGGSSFYIGERLVNSVDTFHPINYRPEFNTTSQNATTMKQSVPNVLPEHFVRPNLVAQENAANPNRTGALATAVSRGARLADQLMLRGLQLSPCNPSFVEMRDAILAADREISGGENQAVIWRAFASHGVGAEARSTGGTGGTDANGGAQSAPTVTEDFSVPAGVTECESQGPLAAPTFTLSNGAPNSVTVTITAQSGATSYVIGRSANPNGPFTTIATVPSNQTTYTDTDNGDNLTLVKDQTYYYQVRAARNAFCVGAASVQSVVISLGNPPAPAPVFFGLTSVVDPRQNDILTLNWSPASSLNPNASIVYDIFRVTSITTGSGQTDSTTAPTFTPNASNRVTPSSGVTGTSFTDTNLTLGQVYYYIVQARDTNNGKKDTLNIGNTVAKFAAPTSNAVSATPFAIENFQAASANTRFTPILLDQASPNMALATQWQRLTGGESSGMMYAPDLDPPNDGTGAPSDIYAVIGPITLSPTSVLEFDTKFSTEFGFDGGVVEVSIGSPTFNATPFPDNATTFDLNYFIFENSYTGKLDGTLAGPVLLSPLQGRFAFAGNRSISRVRAALGSFAGGSLNPTNQPVFIRFRSVSDAGTSPGAGSGLYVDNLVVNNFIPANLSIAGVVNYGTSETAKAVPGVLMSVTNSNSAPVNTDSLGAYLITNLAASTQYTVTPSKSGNVNGITPFDATLVLRCVAAGSSCTLTANQKLAADTNDSGDITPFDATQILRFVAANGANGSTGQVGNWKFAPNKRDYNPLTESLTGQNYAALLVGEINGSWSASASNSFAAPEESQEQGQPEQTGNKKREEPIIAATGVQVSLPENITAAPGDTVTIPVAFNNGNRLSGYALEVEFDPTMLQPDAAMPIETDGTLTSGSRLQVDTQTRGRIGIAASNAINESGTLIRLRFRVVGRADAASNAKAITLTRALFEEMSSGSAVQTSVANGQFTVAASTKTEKPLSKRN